MSALISLEVTLKGEASIELTEYECWGEWEPEGECQRSDAVRLAGLDTAKWGAAKGTRWGLVDAITPTSSRRSCEERDSLRRSRRLDN